MRKGFLPTVVALAALAAPHPAEAQALRSYVLQQAQSSVFVVTHRSGILSFLGHEHAIGPMEWMATLCLADPIPAGAHGSVAIETRSLVIDSDSMRHLAGLGGGPGPEDRLTIQGKLLDPAHLDSAAYPTIRLSVESLQEERDGVVRARATLVLRGVERSYALPVRVDLTHGGPVVLHGRLRVRQTEFGIEPESIGGVVKVSDEVELHFRLAALPTDRPCPQQTTGMPDRPEAP